jgi:hypothetical protein
MVSVVAVKPLVFFFFFAMVWAAKCVAFSGLASLNFSPSSWWR